MEYDGTQYAGFQRQSTLPSIQGAFEQALRTATGTPLPITGAGRTDAGAHARGQVVSFVTESRLDDQILMRAINAHLPNDIAVQSVESVGGQFDPRRDATRREYHYLVVVRETPAPLWRNRAHRVGRRLDVEAMRRAGQCLIGVHDFGAFGSPSAADRSSVRELFSLEIVESSEIFRFEFIGSSFLHHMIRSIVGTLLEVGLGKLEADTVCDILNSRDRKRSAAPVPACGLYLENVTYGPAADRKGFDG